MSYGYGAALRKPKRGAKSEPNTKLDQNLLGKTLMARHTCVRTTSDGNPSTWRQTHKHPKSHGVYASHCCRCFPYKYSVVKLWPEHDSKLHWQSNFCCICQNGACDSRILIMVVLVLHAVVIVSFIPKRHTNKFPITNIYIYDKSRKNLWCGYNFWVEHYNNVIMSAMSSRIASLTSVYSTV